MGNLIAYSNKKEPTLKNFAKQAKGLPMGQSIKNLLVSMASGELKPDI